MLSSPSIAEEKHPLTLDELFRLEDIHAVCISPDGTQLAFVRSRPRSPGERYLGGRLKPHEREDVWVVDVYGARSVKPLTDGAVDGSSYSEPVWAPDSRHLLILSDRGFDNVHLETVDIQSGKIARLSERGINLEGWVSGSQEVPGPRVGLSTPDLKPMAWLDTRHVLFVELAAGEVSTAISEGTRRIEVIARDWSRTEAGMAPSFSRLDSIKSASPRSPGRLVIADVDTGRLTEVAEGVFRKVTVSNDGRFASVISEEKPVTLNESTKVRWPRYWHSYPTTENFHTSFGIVRLAPRPRFERFPEITDPGFDFIPHGPNGPPIPGSVETYSGPIWLAHETRVAVLGKGDSSSNDSDVLYLVDAENGTLRKVPHRGLAVFNIVAVGDDVFLYGTEDLVSAYDPSHNYNWYSIEGNALSTGARATKGVTGDIFPLTESLGVIVDTKGGGLWPVRNGKLGKYLESKDIEGSSVLWPNIHELSALGSSVVLFQTRGGGLELVAPSATGISIEPFVERSHSEFVSFSPLNRILAAVSRSDSGTELDVKVPDRFWEPLLKVNTFLEEVYAPKFIDLRYNAEDGRDTSARLFLPPTYRKGDQLPTVTWVYISARSDILLSNNNAGFDNLTLWFQHGFAVLAPTINPREYSFKFAPYRSLPRDVVPAVRAAVASGITDPRRVYLLGHSYGAYSTYSLVEQTDVFAAAAAINGPSDLLSEYLDLDPNVRHQDWAFEHTFGVQGELESAHSSMALGAIPWMNIDRYIQNSPVWHVDRIRTPLLIVHSDSDSFDMHNADDMFAGLLRLGKEARYLRFWGEPHSLDSPANIRQFWEEIVQWFNLHQKSFASQ